MSRIHLGHILALAAFAAVAPAAFGAGTLLLSDDFESYGSTAAMNAAWNANAGATSNLDTALPGIPPAVTTQSLQNVAGTSTQSARTINPTAIKPTDSTPIYWTFDYYWDGNGNKRMTGGIRMGASTDILEMGYYNAARNSFTSPAGGNANGSGLAVRTVNIPGSGTLPENQFGAGGWIMMPNATNTNVFSLSGLGNTWFRFSALIQSHSVTYTIDAGRDGTIDSTYVATSASLDLTAAAFDTARLGTGLTSTGGGADFDNIVIRSLASGDANYNGVIDADDYAQIDRGAAMHLTGWGNGDFNNDGVIDQNDYLLIDTSYSQQLGHAPADLLAERESQFGADYVSQLVAAVPEPVTAFPLAALALSVLPGRRHRASGI